MNPKIMKLRGELEKNKGKISDLQGRNRELEKQIRELEDTDIIGMQNLPIISTATMLLQDAVSLTICSTAAMQAAMWAA